MRALHHVASDRSSAATATQQTQRVHDYTRPRGTAGKTLFLHAEFAVSKKSLGAMRKARECTIVLAMARGGRAVSPAERRRDMEVSA